MSTLIPVHPSITELSDEDQERLYLDDEPRWVGPSAPSPAWAERCRILVDAYARELADAIVDGVHDEWALDWRREEYSRVRAQLRHVEAVERHVYARGSEGFAGWIVRGA